MGGFAMFRFAGTSGALVATLVIGIGLGAWLARDDSTRAIAQEAPPAPPDGPGGPPDPFAEAAKMIMRGSMPSTTPGMAGRPLPIVPAELKLDQAFVMLPPDEHGRMSVRRGLSEASLRETGYDVRPYYDHWFRVWSPLAVMKAPRQDVELAEEVARVLEAERPENPGRAKSFPKWTTAEVPGRPSIPLVPSGWSLTIRQVEAIPDGWRARVEVSPVVRTETYEPVTIRVFHVEIYTFKGGKLQLQEDYPDPRREDDPEAGMPAQVGSAFMM